MKHLLPGVEEMDDFDVEVNPAAFPPVQFHPVWR
jgi:hypothetical protein